MTLFILGLVAILINVFAKSALISAAIVFLEIGAMLNVTSNSWLQYAAIALMIGAIFGAIRNYKQGEIS